jgi:stage II sporulation protein D
VKIPLFKEPNITVGIVDRQSKVGGRLDGTFAGRDIGPLSGEFSAKVTEGAVKLFDEAQREIACAGRLRLAAPKGSTFSLFNVTIGNRFHWQRNEDQTFRGNLILQARKDGTITAVNQIPLEEYLQSVVSSEMSGAAPTEFLKAHAILSRSWLLASLKGRKKTGQKFIPVAKTLQKEGEVNRWYDREEHDLFDVCADDHCQRYQGITKITSGEATEAVRQTRGLVITYRGKICDARYSKACGGLTEEFATAWDNKGVPYLKSISDAPVAYGAIETEEEADRWIRSRPEAYCHTKDKALLEKILPVFDRETATFFRWTVEYSRYELERIVRQKSGIDFGALQEIVPLERGPSGRISRLKLVGSKMSIVVGKELEIRRWLSPSHLYSSAFVITVVRNPRGEAERFILHGAGWGHGVGFCQIGAAVMATRGFSAEQILKHYFRGVKISRVY